jgi:hypothetical protein
MNVIIGSRYTATIMGHCIHTLELFKFVQTCHEILWKSQNFMMMMFGFCLGFSLVVDASRICQFHSSESFEYLVFDVLDKDEPIDENDVATTRGIITAIIATHSIQNPTWPFIGNRIANLFIVK